MKSDNLDEIINSFVAMKEAINAEPSEKRRLELYEEMQILKADILTTCQKNVGASIIIKLIQNGLI